MLHSRTKHLEIDFYFIRDKIQIGDIVVEYVPNEAQIVDIIIKSFHTPQFQNLRLKLTILNRISN